MYLKRLELQGFKSFPEKIKLEFHKGITAVVGPNGSGKSNISDAVRWVLGEQSAKSLRGAKMEDVIFSGTENRRPLSFAQVSMIIDNEDHLLSLPYSEITVTRKVYRSGESEYLLNGTSCRLKDIHELFMDTGVGKEGYSVIGQGRIDEILSTRGEERRLLFEEAAGIIKYKNRRREAYESLEKEKQNLTRIQDIIRELFGQMDPLLRQSEAAKQYLSLKERLKLLQVNLFLIQADKGKEISDDIEDKLEDVDLQIEEENQNLEALRQAYENLNTEVAATEILIKTQGGQSMEFRSMMEQRENDIKLSNEQLQHFDSTILRLEKEIEKKQDALALRQTEKDEEQTKYQECSLSFYAKKEALEKQELEFGDFCSKMSEAQQQVEQYNTNIYSGLQHFSGIKSEIQRHESIYERTGERKEQLDTEARQNTGLLNEKNEKTHSLKNRIDSLSEEIRSLKAGLMQMEIESKQLSNALGEKQSILGSVSKTLHEAASRQQLLSELSGDHEGYYKSVKAILKHKDSGEQSFSGVHGAVGEIVTVPKTYETALTIALGGNVQSIVVGNETDARHAIEYLKKTNKGRATFLPLSAASSRGSVVSEALNEPGVLGIAKNLIEYDKLYESVMDSLLGRVLIVDTLPRAIELYKKYRYSIRIVTIEGDSLTPGGAMTGGSSQKTSVFTRRRELQELTESVTALQSREKEVKAELGHLERQFALTEKAMRESKEQLSLRKLEKTAAAQSLEEAAIDTKALLKKQDEYYVENVRLMEQLQATNMEIRKLNRELIAAEEDIARSKDTLEQFQKSVALEQSVRDEKIRELTDLKVELGGQEQILKASSETIKRIEQDITGVKSELEACRTEIAETLLDVEEKSRVRKDYLVQLEKLREEFSTSQNQLTSLEETKKQLSLQLAEKGNEEKEQISLIADLQKERLRHTLRKEQLEQDTRRLYDQMWDEYKLTYLGAYEYPRLNLSLEKMQREERQIKSEIEGLGPVNVRAIEEYKSVSGRYEFLTKQADDIVKAEDKLKDLIMELSRQMEEQFLERFKRISENFSVVFREMFGGGRAYLELADESRVLESSIDIVAQPPGKNLQSMTLLSGGERALTATALLFAMLRLKPSPFCILDEVEAALDDANVTRYANLLKNFYNDTQFILITHRKGTMEIADILYGITMQEQGISKLVSVKLTNALQ